MYYIKVSVARCGNGLGIHLCNSEIPVGLNLQDSNWIPYKRYQYIKCAIQILLVTFRDLELEILKGSRSLIKVLQQRASLFLLACLLLHTFQKDGWLLKSLVEDVTKSMYACLAPSNTKTILQKCNIQLLSNWVLTIRKGEYGVKMYCQKASTI